MGKLGAFAAGAGQGYFAMERYKDSKKRAEKQDELLKEILTGNKGDMKKPVPAANPTLGEYFADRFNGLFKPGVALHRWNPSMDDMDRERYANGGMVQSMPQHWDKMSWQRVSFKK
jgi:hypothetical protein